MKKLKKTSRAVVKWYRDEELDFKELQYLTDFGKDWLMLMIILGYLYGGHCFLWNMTHPLG